MSESYSWNDAICQKVLKKYKFEKGNIVNDITHVQQEKEMCSESRKCWTLRFAPVVLSFWFVVVLNLQTFVHGLDFCFDGSKEGGFRFIESIY